MDIRYLGSFAALGLAAAVQAGPITNITDTSVANQSAVTGGLVALDLSGLGISGLSGTNNNILSVNFASSSGGAFNGSLTATVFGNIGAPGSGLNTVAIVYDFVGSGPDPIDNFQFGLNSGANIDLSDLAAATQGTINDQTTSGQTSPLVTLEDNSGVPANDTFTFSFIDAGDLLGGVSLTEHFVWYVLSDGSVQIGTAKVEVTNNGNAIFDMLTLVKIPGQADLNMVPLPGAAGMGIVGLAMVMGRRRRSAPSLD